MRLSNELIEKAKTTKTPEELMKFAKCEDVTLSLEAATAYFKRLNVKLGKVADEELDNVTGGGCGNSSDGRLIISRLYSCERFRKSSSPKDDYGKYCQNCFYAEVVGGEYLFCNNDINRK